jgi:ferric-dicitrate binding protein FerR (iron transport regulator)
MNSEDKIQSCEKLKRYIENNYSAEDLEYISLHINDPGTEKTLISICKEYWYHRFDLIPENKEEPDFKSLLDQMHHKINLIDNKPVSVKSSTSPTMNVIRTAVRVFYRIAAVLVISAIIIGVPYYLKNGGFSSEADLRYSEIIAPLGSRIRIDLPDGSSAWLNHGTILKYPQNFGKKTRELFISGEAYFNVREDKKRPFILQTSEISICVKGTTFNIMAYADDNAVEVTLEQGKLDMYAGSVDDEQNKISSLRPGDHVIYDLTTEKVTKNILRDTDIYTAWKDGYIVFRDDPMESIIKKLERWYNVEIELTDKELLDYRFTATFTDETLPQVLHLLSIAVPMDYTISSRIKQEDDTYSKDKVFIKLRHESN